jgi:hypothetical protein
MYTPIEVHFSESCWRLLHDDTLPIPLSRELRAVLDLGPRLRVVPPDPSPRYVVTMLRLHAHELTAFVGRVFLALPEDDARRRDCRRCLEDLGEGVMPSERA